VKTILNTAAAVMLCVCATVAAARPLEEIRTRKEISVCANPNALPFASDKPDTPGFQIEIARALAKQLGVNLKVEWIIPRYRASTVDCDMLMDTIVRKDVERPPGLKVTIPYQTSGVALVFGPGKRTVPTYQDLPAGMKVGVMMSSMASFIVSKTPARMVPFGFEDDLVEAIASGEVDVGALSPATAGYYNMKNPNRQVNVVHAEDAEPELRWSVAIGLRRADDALVEAVNAALTVLMHDDMIAGIYRKYAVDYRRPQ
jgi:polar amino acid transport system substrate-binding protein